ncbi:HpcH/HpaI aldolase/citrate lyase family protein [Bauldia litoralis]|uniref:Citrate lyase subunit beta / citryl-CoA lyase n=1 Tax=Bauldia litoralis TaxID=665467 RepID=A0A1G6ACL8_9HYPH|nr:CoA ester lyase [Bauldia litoralis]SDB06119.1 citrate lyase subunit beta / citryl-CoA lyase [Bauldia litoralis]
MAAAPRPRRSALYIPGSNARALDKGRTIAADVLILDLEDAVAVEAKEMARAAVAAAVNVHAYGKREVVVRVNGLGTPWIARDIAAVVAAMPDAILIPKISRMEDVRRARAALAAAQAPEGLALWAMIETPLAVLNAAGIASAANNGAGAALDTLVIGTNDLAREMGVRLLPGRAALTPALSHCVLAARAYGLAVLDGTFNDLTDWKGFDTECQQGRDLGMDGKTLIHPRQVPIANEAFAPSNDEVEWAEKVLAAFDRPENHGKAVIAVEGQMVERMHERMALRVIETVTAILPDE